MAKHIIKGWNADFEYKSDKYGINGVLVFKLSSSGEWEYKTGCLDMESAIAMVEYFQNGRDEQYILIKHSKMEVVTSKVKKTEISTEEIVRRQSAIWN